MNHHWSFVILLWNLYLTFCLLLLLLLLFCRSSSVDVPTPQTTVVPGLVSKRADEQETAAVAAAAAPQEEERGEEEEEEEEEGPPAAPAGPQHTSPDHSFGSEVRELLIHQRYTMEEDYCIPTRDKQQQCSPTYIGQRHTFYSWNTSTIICHQSTENTNTNKIIQNKVFLI